MQEKHLQTLEFPKVLERLAEHAAFSASQKLAFSLKPTSFLSEAQVWQAETAEADRLLLAKPNIGVGGARDVRPLVARTERGFTLTPSELLEIRQTLIAARDLQRIILRLAEDYPHLTDIAQRIEECPGLVNEIGQAIEESGNIKDSASPDLARIRRELESAHQRLLEKVNRLLASSQYRNYLQESLVTQREGRYVLPIKAEFKGRVQGVVHDQSSSGATLFIEPLSTVALNNQWRQRQLDEKEEMQRILVALSEAVGQQEAFIKHTVAALAELDLALAKAKYAQLLEANRPLLFSLQEEKKSKKTLTFSLRSARHPLLDPQTVVPIDVELPPETHLLVITGPNTGGKTVSLKTIGLLAMMAQAGLQIPVEEGSSLPFFKQIFADIGDEQSIEQSLSTFSAHMTNIVQILQKCDQDSLVILDELGAGTDPIEGSALARSILSDLLARRITTFVATHFSELKAFAHATEGVTNASMEFDLESLGPTYRLRIGLPGASNAFAIAHRLGLSEQIIQQAKGLITEDNQQVEVMLAEIKSELETAQTIRHQAEMERTKIVDREKQLQKQLDNIDQERRDILGDVRADARREIKKVRQELRALKEKAQAQIQAQTQAQAQAQKAQAQKTASESSEVEAVEERLSTLDSEVETKQEALTQVEEPSPPSESAPSGPVRPGDKVFIAQFNTVGEVVTIQNKQVEVQLGHFRATVPMKKVELRERKKHSSPAASPQSSVRIPEVESPGTELDLRGQVSEEAILHLDQYLDQAFLARLPWVRIIHGKGSGTLRQVVRESLSQHPMISSYRPGGHGEGGEGVTVAQLALS